MKKQDMIERERKFLATIMIISGAIIWIFNGSDKQIISNIIQGTGLFLFIFGLASMHRFRKALSNKQKVIQAVIVVTLILLLLFGIFFIAFQS